MACHLLCSRDKEDIMAKQICQSCGMPLNQDPEKGGTEADGKHSSKYCSFCFEDGKFTGPIKNAKEMQNFCLNRLMEKKMPRAFAWVLTRGIPHLERWKNSGSRSVS